MKMTDEISLPVGQDEAWKALNDVNLLKTCIPGCESINLREDGSYEVVVAAAVGPIRARFTGEMRMLDLVAPSSYRLEFNMQGGAVGFGRGEASVELSPVDESTTLLKYTAAASVGGKIAQVGARLIDITAKKMAAQFFEAFRKRLVHGDQISSEDKNKTIKEKTSERLYNNSVINENLNKSDKNIPTDNSLVIKIEININDNSGILKRGSWLSRVWGAIINR